MGKAAQALRYITDGTFSVADARGSLAAAGELVELPSGEVKFVPDDPSFPATFFLEGGFIELRPRRGDEVRLEVYLDQLSSWLGVVLQPIGR